MSLSQQNMDTWIQVVIIRLRNAGFSVVFDSQEALGRRKMAIGRLYLSANVSS